MIQVGDHVQRLKIHITNPKSKFIPQVTNLRLQVHIKCTKSRPTPEEQIKRQQPIHRAGVQILGSLHNHIAQILLWRLLPNPQNANLKLKIHFPTSVNAVHFFVQKPISKLPGSDHRTKVHKNAHTTSQSLISHFKGSFRRLISKLFRPGPAHKS